VHLTWATATEVNNDHFVIERSQDGMLFESIGSIPGNGNSNTILGYSFIDANPLAGKSYYRLAQYDYNGKSEVSEVKSVDFLTQNAVTVSPNPFEGTTRLSVSGSFKLKIISIQGSLVEEQEYNAISNENYTIGKNLNPGLYLLYIITPQNTFTYKIEKLN
jgi:hypothetical protein